jgi:hypothetical protein
VHGKIGSFYFYEKDSNDDAAFGFFDVELSVQSIATGKVRVELYCVADGYQTSRGVGAMSRSVPSTSSRRARRLRSRRSNGTGTSNRSSNGKLGSRALAHPTKSKREVVVLPTR